MKGQSAAKSPLAPLPTGASGRSALEVATEAARLAGRILLQRFQERLQVTHKGRGNVVTDVDKQVEQEVLALLRREFPGFGFLAEESPEVSTASPYTWVVDPLDGTLNFASGVPFFSVVIALAHDGAVVLGLTYDPVRDELFLAQKGAGATLNGRPMRVSKRSELRQCLLGLDMGYNDEKALRALKLLQSLWPGMQGIRIMGSSALGQAYAAAGRVDLYFHHQLAPWDIAAGLLLVPEAGGVITDRLGRPAGLHADGIIATNRTLHSQFLRATEGSPWRM